MASIRKHSYYHCGHKTTTIRASWSGADDFNITGFTMLYDSRWMLNWKSAHSKIKWTVINQPFRWINKFPFQNTCPKLCFECFKDHPYRNVRIKHRNVINICSVEVPLNDVLLIFPLQSNATLHAPVTTGGIHSNDRKVSSTRVQFKNCCFLHAQVT